MFDSQADIAAVVYGPGDDPDRLQREFADDLRLCGHRVVGLVQVGRRCGMVQERMPALALPTRETVSLHHVRELAPAACHLDEEEFAETRRRVAAAIDEGADLVIINRFGKLEAAGTGFAGEIRRAVAADIPVLIAVPHQRFHTWIRFCAGMAVKLRCAREEIDGWWRFATAGRTSPVLEGDVLRNREIGPQAPSSDRRRSLARRQRTRTVLLPLANLVPAAKDDLLRRLAEEMIS